MNKQILPSNGYGLKDCEYDELVERIYGFEEYYYYKDENHHDDYMFILNELDKIHRNVPMIENYRNALLGWYISFQNIPRKLNKKCFLFKITDSCQLKCKHCYQQFIKHKNKNMSYDSFVFLFNKHLRISDSFYIKDKPCSEIVIEGGEATLNKDLPKIIEFVNSKKIFVTLLTNGIHMPDDVLCALKGHPKNRVQISIDGLEETHDYIRGKGTFQKSISTIKLLRDNGINVYCNFVIHSINYKEFIPLQKYLLNEGVELNCMHYTSQNKDDIQGLNKEELEIVMPYYKESSRNYAIGTLRCNEGIISSILEEGDFLSCRRIMSEDFHSIANYFNDSDEECVQKIKKYAIRSRSIPAYCIPCKKVNTCLGGMLCSRTRKENMFNLEDEVCHLLNKAEF